MTFLEEPTGFGTYNRQNQPHNLRTASKPKCTYPLRLYMSYTTCLPTFRTQQTNTTAKANGEEKNETLERCRGANNANYRETLDRWGFTTPSTAQHTRYCTVRTHNARKHSYTFNTVTNEANTSTVRTGHTHQDTHRSPTARHRATMKEKTKIRKKKRRLL